MKIRSLTMLMACAAMALAGACAHSSAEIKEARGSAYQADFPTVWKGVHDSIKKRYPRIKQDDADTGLIVTDWHLVDKDIDEQETSYGARGGVATKQGTYFRVFIKIVGKAPPFQILVDGEASLYRPGLAELKPWKHGEPGEPQWVPGKIDAVYIAIHDQLKKYAVPIAAAPGPTPAVAPTPDTTTPATPATPVDPADAPPAPADPNAPAPPTN